MYGLKYVGSEQPVEHRDHEIKEAAEVLKRAEVIKLDKKLYKAALGYLKCEHEALVNVPGLKLPPMKGV